MLVELISGTDNELEIAILNLFVDIRVRYRNLVVGKLDRKHVKAAMEKGISAHQIISYLASHAHPQMYNSVSCFSSAHAQLAHDYSLRPSCTPPSLISCTYGTRNGIA